MPVIWCIAHICLLLNIPIHADSFLLPMPASLSPRVFSDHRSCWVPGRLKYQWVNIPRNSLQINDRWELVAEFSIFLILWVGQLLGMLYITSQSYTVDMSPVPHTVTSSWTHPLTGSFPSLAMLPNITFQITPSLNFSLRVCSGETQSRLA